MSLIAVCTVCTLGEPAVIAQCPRCGGPIVHHQHAFQDRHKPACAVFALGSAAIMSEAVRKELAPRARMKK